MMNAPTLGISFVVIARNEEFAIEKCLSSIVDLRAVGREIICVDSGSTDRTLEVMKSFAERHPDIHVIEVPKCLNAAMARNHGIRKASKPYIFFVDGDIELNPDFLHEALEKMGESGTSAVTGDLEEIIYDDKTRSPIKRIRSRFAIHERNYVLKCGGAYIAKRDAVQSTGYYDERFFINEDSDYTLRLTSSHPMLAIPVSMGIHHTGMYRNRLFSYFLHGYIANSGMLLRRHWRRPGFISDWYRNHKKYVVGVSIYMLAMVLLYAWSVGILDSVQLAIGIGIVLMLLVGYSWRRRQPVAVSLTSYFLCTPMVLAGLLMEPFIARDRRTRPYA